MTPAEAGVAAAALIMAVSAGARTARRVTGTGQVLRRLDPADPHGPVATLASPPSPPSPRSPWPRSAPASARGRRSGWRFGSVLRSWATGQARSLALPDSADRIAVPVSVGVIGSPVVAALVAGPLPGVVVALVVGAGLAVAWRSAPLRRAASVDRELPLVLESVARRLRAGGSLAQALDTAEVPGDGDLAVGWGRMVALSRTIGVGAAIDDWAARSGRPSVCLAAAALALANETGGSPARAVDGVATTLRSRLAVTAEIRALTSQARASAVVIALAPVGFGAFAGIADPRTAAFLATPAGTALLAGGLCLDGLGTWWMVRLCRPPA